MPNNLRLDIPSDDPRLKRRINHDIRSARYPLRTAGLDVADVDWALIIARLNQLQVGKCTAEAACELLGSLPFYYTLPAGVGKQLNDQWTDGFYSDEETLDGDGPFPPNDNGSDGLTSAKVAKNRGLISGYQHTFTALDALKGLQNYPAAWGTYWRSGMDNVNVDTGQVKYTGGVRGGHELSLFKVDAKLERVWFHNHWGAWGYHNTGDAWISFADFEASLADQGDVTFFVPLTEPAPTPTPAVYSIRFTGDTVAQLDAWAVKPHTGANRRAAQDWLTGVRA